MTFSCGEDRKRVRTNHSRPYNVRHRITSFVEKMEQVPEWCLRTIVRIVEALSTCNENLLDSQRVHLELLLRELVAVDVLDNSGVVSTLPSQDPRQ